jgi:hypothetical protein
MSQHDLFADEAAAEAAFALPPDPREEIRALGSGTAFPEDVRRQEPTKEEKSAPESVEEDIPEFDPAYRQPFKGLLYVGALTKSFELFGHHFTIATPTQTERLQIGQVIEPFQNTLTAEIAYQTALVAAYLVDIDGTKLPEPVVTNPKETALHDRFRWASENLRRPVLDRIFDECLKLDRLVDEVLAAMGKASG